MFVIAMLAINAACVFILAPHVYRAGQRFADWRLDRQERRRRPR